MSVPSLASLRAGCSLPRSGGRQKRRPMPPANAHRQFLGLCLITIHHAITPQKEEEARKSDRQAQCLPTACPLLRPTAGHAGQNANNKKVDMTNATGDFREIPLAEYLFEIIGWLQGC
eukprot:GHVT01053002.1.p2 GENE.GHVT01053002.1~~GHVT01053002.1.p2  ORF type:complete len:118 (-),score=13.02 GHVT01053002.1:335-688(-)